MANPSHFVWHDLSTPDPEASKRFYGELFSWSFQGDESEDPYEHIQVGDRMIGGMRRKGADEPGPPSWLGYVLVEDVAETLERAQAAGAAAYVPKTDMPGVGTFAVLADPTGGVVAPWRSAREEENGIEAVAPAMHTFCWDELLTTDPAAAATFYTEVFGWESETQDMGPRGNYTLLSRPGIANPMRAGESAWAGGLLRTPVGVTFSFWLPYVLVEDADAIAERAAALGAEVAVEPTTLPDIGRFCVFTDPLGATLAAITSGES